MTSRIFCLIFFFTKKIANYLFDFVIQCERLSKDRQKNRHGWPQDLLFHWLLSIRESRVPIVRRNVFKTISRYRVVRFRVTKLVLSVSGQRIRIRARLSFLITCLHFFFSIITCIRSFDNVKHSKTFDQFSFSSFLDKIRWKKKKIHFFVDWSDYTANKDSEKKLNARYEAPMRG